MVDEFRRYHPIVVPFNVITYPVSLCYVMIHGDTRAKVCRSWKHMQYILYTYMLYCYLPKGLFRNNNQGWETKKIENQMNITQRRSVRFWGCTRRGEEKLWRRRRSNLGESGVCSPWKCFNLGSRKCHFQRFPQDIFSKLISRKMK